MKKVNIKYYAMKQFIFSILLLYAMGVTAQVDDMYFVPKKSEKKAANAKTVNQGVMQTTQERLQTTQESLSPGYGLSNEMDEDAYNRRRTPASYRHRLYILYPNTMGC